MPVLSTQARDRRALHEALSHEARLVVCLCAAWCDTCEEFRSTFERLSQGDPGSVYLWIDIEDDSELVGDLDIENFPTLAVFRGALPLYYGVTLPQEPVVARTLASLCADARAQANVPEAVRALPRALRETTLPSSRE